MFANIVHIIYPALQQYQLIQIPTLIFSLIALAVIVAAAFIAPKYNLHEVRTMSQVDAMIEAAGVAAEKGRPFLFTPGVVTPGFGTVGRDVPSILNVLKYVSYETCKLNVPTFVTVADPMVHGMCMDYVRQATMEEGHPERFRGENILWMPGGYAITLGTVGVLERNDCQGVVVWGVYWWCTHVPVMEAAVRRKSFLVAGQNWTGEGAVCAMFTDQVAVCEELTAAGVYVTKDPVQGSTLFGEDLIKIGLMGFMVILAVAALMGVKF